MSRVTWADARKDAIFTAASAASDVWFSCAAGELTEVFHPSPDRACVRGLSFTIDGAAAAHRAGALDRAIYRAHLAWPDGARVTVEIAADPDAPQLVLRASGARGLGCRFAPRLADEQRAWFDGGAASAESADRGLALVGAHACTGRDGDELLLALPETPEVLLALGFGATAADARAIASESLARGFPADPGARWDTRIDGLTTPLAIRSIQVLATLTAKHDRGAQVAALSTPWGPVHDLGGTYHVVWTRDLVQGAIALFPHIFFIGLPLAWLTRKDVP